MYLVIASLPQVPTQPNFFDDLTTARAYLEKAKEELTTAYQGTPRSISLYNKSTLVLGYFFHPDSNAVTTMSLGRATAALPRPDDLVMYTAPRLFI